MKCFGSTEGLFHVYVVPTIPAGSGEKPRREKATGCPVDWARACQWVHGIMTEIGRGNSARFTDCEIEPARPWTQEISAAFQRERRRCSIEADLCGEREGVKRLHAELSRTRGVEFADAVQCGAA